MTPPDWTLTKFPNTKLPDAIDTSPEHVVTTENQADLDRRVALHSAALAEEQGRKDAEYWDGVDNVIAQVIPRKAPRTTVEEERAASLAMRRPKGHMKSLVELVVEEESYSSASSAGRNAPLIRHAVHVLAARGNISIAEYEALRINSYERELLIPGLRDDALVKSVKHALGNCARTRKPSSTYDESIVGLYAPLLVGRVEVLSKEVDELESEVRGLEERAQGYSDMLDDANAKNAELVSERNDAKKAHEGLLRTMGAKLKESFAHMRAQLTRNIENRGNDILNADEAWMRQHPKCEDCGGDLGGTLLGRLEDHVPGCPSFPL